LCAWERQLSPDNNEVKCLLERGLPGPRFNAKSKLFCVFAASDPCSANFFHELTGLLLCFVDDVYQARQAGYLDFPVVLREAQEVLSVSLEAEPLHFAALLAIISHTAQTRFFSRNWGAGLMSLWC
jgi:hypothetical protein